MLRTTRALVHWMKFLELELISKLWIWIYFILRLQWSYSLVVVALRLTGLQWVWLLAWKHAMSLVDGLHLRCLAVNPICTSGILLLLLAAQGLLISIEVSAIFHLYKLAPMSIHKCLLRRSRLLIRGWSLSRYGRRTDSTRCICWVSLVKQRKLLSLERLVTALLWLGVVILRWVVLGSDFKVVFVHFGWCLDWLHQVMLLGYSYTGV